MGPEQERTWSLEAAREILAEVRRRTERAVQETERLTEQRGACEPDSPDREALDAKIEAAVGRWAREMDALGLEVKGLWLVDFDNGRGYYCWKWPEEALDYFHGYEDGFAGRIRIQ